MVWIYTHTNHSHKLQREYDPNLVGNIGSEENTACYKMQISYILWQLNCFIYNISIWRNSVFPQKTW